MFRNLKLKNTTLCALSLYIIPLLIIIAGIISFALIHNKEIAALVIICTFGISLFFLIKSFLIMTSADITLSLLASWQKDRLSFNTDINGSSLTEVEKAICERASNWGGLHAENNGAVITRYKNTRTLTGFKKCIHQTFLVYSTPTLTFDDYRKTLDRAKQKTEELMKNKDEEAAAVGIIFLTERAEQSVLNSVREDRVDEINYVVLPLVYDVATRQYIFNAFYGYNMFGKSTENYILDTIKKLVFGGKLPFENNDRFDYSNEISKWQDKTLGDLLDYIKEEEANDKQFIKNTADQLTNGQVLYDEKEEVLYLKHNDRLAGFYTYTEEDEPEKIFLFGVGTWYYPKEFNITNKENAILKEMAIEYFKLQNKQAQFDEEE